MLLNGVMQCYKYWRSMYYFTKLSHFRSIMVEQLIELSLVKIELLIKTFLYCVTPNRDTHTNWDNQCSRRSIMFKFICPSFFCAGPNLGCFGRLHAEERHPRIPVPSSHAGRIRNRLRPHRSCRLRPLVRTLRAQPHEASPWHHAPPADRVGVGAIDSRHGLWRRVRNDSAQVGEKARGLRQPGARRADQHFLAHPAVDPRGKRRALCIHRPVWVLLGGDSDRDAEPGRGARALVRVPGSLPSWGARGIHKHCVREWPWRVACRLQLEQEPPELLLPHHPGHGLDELCRVLLRHQVVQLRQFLQPG